MGSPRLIGKITRLAPFCQLFRKSVKGSIISDAKTKSTPLTAIPRIRKGSNITQTIGYSTKAISATGQQRTNKMHQRRNFTMACPHSAFSRKHRPYETQSLIIHYDPCMPEVRFKIRSACLLSRCNRAQTPAMQSDEWPKPLGRDHDEFIN